MNIALTISNNNALWMLAAGAYPIYFKYEARQRANAPGASDWDKLGVPPSELNEPAS